MIDYDFEDSVSYWVGLTSHAFELALNSELASTGVTMRQVQVLSCLALHKQLAQVEIADMLRVEPSTLVRILDRMERDGWIERHDSTADRRKKLIAVTDKVNGTWTELVRLGKRMEAQATANLTEEQLGQLKTILATIRQNLGADS